MKVETRKDFEFSELERKEVEKYVKKMIKKGYRYNEIEITSSEDSFPKYVASLKKTKEVEIKIC